MATRLARSDDGFQKNLAFGQIAETEIARWIISRGNSILPIYDIEYDTGKGPRLFTPEHDLVAPDMLVISKVGAVQWIEAKHKTVFTWHRKTSRWTTGIDAHHYVAYLQVGRLTPWPIWLLFLHRSSKPDSRDLRSGCTELCPTGLFGGRLDDLDREINHRHQNWGKSGMVYWAHESLKLLAPLNEIEVEKNNMEIT